MAAALYVLLFQQVERKTQIGDVDRLALRAPQWAPFDDCDATLHARRMHEDDDGTGDDGQSAHDSDALDPLSAPFGGVEAAGLFLNDVVEAGGNLVPVGFVQPD